jgi:hypothetical protein
MEHKIRKLESFGREISTLEGGNLDINVHPNSELHEEIMSMERKMLKGSLFI